MNADVAVTLCVVAGDTAEGGHCQATAPGGAAALRAPQWQVHYLGEYCFSEHVRYLLLHTLQAFTSF